MFPWSGKRQVTVLTACMNSHGFPNFAFTEVEVTYGDFTEGVHYDLVSDRLLAAGCEEPFVHFDEGDAACFLTPAVQQFLGVSLSSSEPIIPVLPETF